MRVVHRGRPRSERARIAILVATVDLLFKHELGAITVDAIAEQARVSKATIYRWWPTKENLALDALYFAWGEDGPAEPPDTGSLEGDLWELIRPWVRSLRRRPYGRSMASIIVAAQTDEAFAEQYREQFVRPRREQARALFTQAIDRNEIPATTNVEVALDLLYGAIYHRMLHGHAPLTERFARQVVGQVTRAVS